MLLALLACTDPNKDAPDTTDTADPDSGDTDSGDTDSGDTGHDTGNTGPYDEAFTAIRRAVRSDLRSDMATGAQVAIWYQGQIIFSEGFGTKSPDTDESVATTTLFQIGSDTKKITAIALLRQVEAGRVSLDETLTDALPDLHFARGAGWSDDITVHELLSHQGDMYDYTPWDDAPDDSELATRAYGRYAENEYALAPGGSYWNYSNPNFSVLGLITQEADGRPWPDIVEDDVFAPLGMTRTFARKAEAEADGDYATGNGYLLLGGADVFDPFSSPTYRMGTVDMAENTDNAFTRPAGMVWSTAEDMVTLAAFLMNGDPDVLADVDRERITTPQVRMYPDSDAFSYGYGMMIMNGFQDGSNYYPVPLWQHGGNTLCMTSTFYVLPEQELAVSILSNGYGDSFARTAVTIFESIPQLPDPEAPPTYFPEATDLASYAGDYLDPFAVGRMHVEWDGTNLNVSMPDLEAAGVTVGATLDPVYADQFSLTLDGTATYIDFADGADGTPHEYAYNRSFGLTRTTDTTVMRRPVTAHWRPGQPVIGPPALPLGR